MGCLESLINVGVGIVFAILSGETGNNNDDVAETVTVGHGHSEQFGMAWDVTDPETGEKAVYSTADYAGGAYYKPNGEYLHR